MRVLVSFLVLAAPWAASAQVCANGQVAVDPAHCCWPGQVLSTESLRCTGEPQCPPEWTPQGETCIVVSATQPSPAPSIPTRPTTPPQAVGYPVRFEAAQQGDEYTVILEKTKSCRTPCELVASPGFQVVKVEGAARFSEVVAFPAAPATVKIEKWRPGGTVAGVVGLAVGLPAATIGGVLALSGAGLGPFSASPGGVIKQPAMTYSGLGLLAVGIAFAAVGGGVGFGIAGHDRLRLTQGQSCAPRAPPLQPLSFGVAPTNGGAIVGAAFAF